LHLGHVLLSIWNYFLLKICLTRAAAPASQKLPGLPPCLEGTDTRFRRSRGRVSFSVTPFLCFAVPEFLRGSRGRYEEHSACMKISRIGRAHQARFHRPVCPLRVRPAEALLDSIRTKVAGSRYTMSALFEVADLFADVRPPQKEFSMPHHARQMNWEDVQRFFLREACLPSQPLALLAAPAARTPALPLRHARLETAPAARSYIPAAPTTIRSLYSTSAARVLRPDCRHACRTPASWVIDSAGHSISGNGRERAAQ